MAKEEYYALKRAPYGTWKCKYCNQVFESKRKLYIHLHSHNDFKKREKTEYFCKYCGKSLGFAKRKGWELHKSICPVFSKLVTENGGHLHSEETKKYLSEQRKHFLLENPDKHPWKNKNKFISKPCEYLKNILQENGFSFLEEYLPLKEHNYSIDIAFPKEKIGIEVNGNQHYKSLITNELSEYYQTRHDLIEAEGWKLLEIHYYNVFIEEEVNKIINLLKNAIANNDNTSLEEYQDRCHSFILKTKKQEKLEKVKKLKQEKEKTFSERKAYFDNIDTTKWGWITQAGKDLKISRTQVRRWLKKYYPEKLGA